MDAAVGAEAGATDEALNDLPGLGLLQGTAQLQMFTGQGRP